jgi:hypothetical protein
MKLLIEDTFPTIDVRTTAGDRCSSPLSTKLTDAEIAEQHVTQLSSWLRYREPA